MSKTTPCDYGECPYGATGGYHCRDFCGLGVDESEPDEEDSYEPTDEDFEMAYNSYYRINDRESYSPSAPWSAPGMTVSDFI
jgi:hypothetical protein